MSPGGYLTRLLYEPPNSLGSPITIHAMPQIARSSLRWQNWPSYFLWANQFLQNVNLWWMWFTICWGIYVHINWVNTFVYVKSKCMPGINHMSFSQCTVHIYDLHGRNMLAFLSSKEQRQWFTYPHNSTVWRKGYTTDVCIASLSDADHVGYTDSWIAPFGIVWVYFKFYQAARELLHEHVQWRKYNWYQKSHGPCMFQACHVTQCLYHLMNDCIVM